MLAPRSILDLIKESRERGKTVLFSTHIMGEVGLLADDLAILHEGKLLWNGTFEDFRREAAGASLEDAFIRAVERTGRA